MSFPRKTALATRRSELRMVQNSADAAAKAFRGDRVSPARARAPVRIRRCAEMSHRDKARQGDWVGVSWRRPRRTSLRLGGGRAAGGYAFDGPRSRLDCVSMGNSGRPGGRGTLEPHGQPVSAAPRRGVLARRASRSSMTPEADLSAQPGPDRVGGESVSSTSTRRGRTVSGRTLGAGPNRRRLW